MRYELFIALRYLRARRRRRALSAISAIAIAGITLGVAALIYALALMNGFRAEVQEKILQGTAHLNLMKADGGDIENYRALTEQLSRVPGVFAVSSTTYAGALLTIGTRQEQAILKGADLSAPASANELTRTMLEGNLRELLPPPASTNHTTTDSPDDSPTPLPGIILGRELARALGAARGQTLTVITAPTRLTPLGVVARPRHTEFQVVGNFASGLYEYDSKWAYVALPTLQQITGTGDVAGTLQMQVQDIYAVDEIAARVRQAAGAEYVTQSWQELNRPLFSALQLQQRVIIVFFTLLIAVAALNLITSLTMMVLEKQGDIGILRAQGATARSIGLIFKTQGLVLGLAGGITGWLLAWLAIRLTNHYRLIALPNEIYSVSFITLRAAWWESLSIMLLALLICLLATLYPAAQAAALSPVEALRRK